MTPLQEQAINLIKNAPDDKVTYVINILSRDISYNTDRELSKSMAAYKYLMSLCRKGTCGEDYKDDLAKALNERYESIS